MKKLVTIILLALSINAIAQIPINSLIRSYPFKGNIGLVQESKFREFFYNFGYQKFQLRLYISLSAPLNLF